MLGGDGEKLEVLRGGVGRRFGREVDGGSRRSSIDGDREKQRDGSCARERRK